MDEKNILEEIKKMLCQSYPTVEITMKTYLELGTGSYLDMSSIEIVQFIVELEKKFDIIIDFEDRYYTIGDAVKGVINQINKRNSNVSEKPNEF